MSGSRDVHRKEIANRESRQEPATASGHSNAQRPQDSKPCVRSHGKPQTRLASDDSREHDSDIWHVTDDWPEFVPITVDEIEIIEAFLRNALGELLSDE
jgi:hypothetical protein